MKRASVMLAIALVRLYQWGLAPILGTNCRFEPSCSRYTIEAFERHGFWRGGRLAMGRILRCHPWGGNGFDPVPNSAVKPHRCDDHAPRTTSAHSRMIEK